MWRSLAWRGKPPEPRLSRYLRSVVMALALDALLLVDWLTGGRTAVALGLAFPVPWAGVVGIGVAACGLLILYLAMLARDRSKSAPNDADLSLFPTTAFEMAAFVPFSLINGCSWELQFRGYLLWFLQPRIGLLLAVLLAAAAYGVAHGYRNSRMFVGGLVSALIFTAAYAATRSLWWLMIVHSGLPLLGAFAVRAQRRALGDSSWGDDPLSGASRPPRLVPPHDA